MQAKVCMRISCAVYMVNWLCPLKIWLQLTDCLHSSHLLLLLC